MSGSASLFNYKTYNVNEIDYEQPRLVRGNSFLAKTQGNKRILFQTPKLMSINQIEIDGKGCHLELQLTEEDKDFYDFLQNLDEKNIGYTYGAASEWFNQDFSYEIIDDFYIPTVKHRSSEKVSNLNYLKVRIPTHKREPNINIYDSKRDKIDWKRIGPGTPLIAIIELKGLKFLQREVICDWEIVQLKAYIERSKVNLTKILIELSKGDDTQVDDEVEVGEKTDNEDNIDNIDNIDKKGKLVNDAGRKHSLPIDGYNNEHSPQDVENNRETRGFHKENKTRMRTTNYNDRVIDKEMVSELAKIDQCSLSSSETSESDQDTDMMASQNQYKIRERREDLLKVMKEADETSKKADYLRNQAAAAAAEIKQIVQDISVEDNNIVSSPAY